MTDPFALIVAGRRVTHNGQETLPVLNPATGAPCGALTCARPEDLDAAAEAAERAWRIWSMTDTAQRADLLEAMAAALEIAQDGIARQITLEQGKPLKEAREELSGAATNLRYYAGVTRAFPFHTMVPGDADRHIFETAKGPVLIANTWNFPVETVVSHLAPALAAGCSAVVLANADTPGSVAAFFDAIKGIDMPEGLVNLVMGDSAMISRHLIAHPKIAHVSYTGSVAVGKQIAAQAGAHMKRATLELGGLAPAIVLPGSEVDEAVRAIGAKRFWNAGQVCTAPNRIYVHRSQYADFVAALATLAQAIHVGDGAAPDTDLGPLANPRRLAWMEQVVEDALSQGARLVTGQSTAGSGGFYWRPTVLADVPESAIGMRQEVFGPVALVQAYDELAQVLTAANDSLLGLSAYVYGPDTAAGLDVARALDAGSVGLNQMTTAFLDTPFGGIKESGLGTIGGPSAMREYLFPKTVAVPAGALPAPKAPKARM